jgi:hypothetical protein
LCAAQASKREIKERHFESHVPKNRAKPWKLNEKSREWEADMAVMQSGESVLDLPLITVGYFFAFIALVFEPLYYFGCDWNHETCYYESSSSVVRLTKVIFSKHVCSNL